MTANYAFWEGVVPSDVCDQILATYSDRPMTDATVFRSVSNKFGVAHDLRKTGVTFEPDPFSYVSCLMRNYILTANTQMGWNFTLQGEEDVQIARYEVGGHYDTHADAAWGDNTIQRKVTAVLFLSDPSTYEGGELAIRLAADEILPRTRGSVVVFPSMVLHRVAPVTSGVRFSAAMWAVGPSFK